MKSLHSPVGVGNYPTRLAFPSFSKSMPNCRLVTVVVGGLYQDPAHMDIPGLGYRSLATFVPAGVLAGYQPQVSHELAGRVDG